MKKLILWNIVVVLLTLGLTTQVAAHNQIGSLGDPVGATDYYLVQCSTDEGGTTGRLYLQIFDGTTTQGGGKLTVTGQFQQVAISASAPVRGAPMPGGPASLLQPGTDGTYTMFVTKLKEGVKQYNVTYHCQSSEGVHTGTSIITVQDQ
ncbi:hypothetical protein [Candidatus Nitrosacidococcus tergens]|uniref:Uncharacterized protein n=1 Tax=Candidatus Nitrosacidococcus tergens TaxID=553981 RepID=A0A7G1Q8F4_9GAMM|nr:hypothetical protein [Candidatus Nitrosacidococcus tergens]CAB1275100.1 conserved exported protein of unknown function [Candidatus Nitrosacidococcus tergens]